MENLEKLFKLAAVLKQRATLTVDQQTMVQGHLEDAMQPDNFVTLMAYVKELQGKIASGTGAVTDSDPAQEPVGYASEFDVKSGMQFKTFDTWQSVRDYYGPSVSVVPVWASAPVTRPVVTPVATVTPISSASAFTAKEAGAIRGSVYFVYDQLNLVYNVLNPTVFPGVGNAINQCVAIAQLIDAKIGAEKRVTTAQPSMAEVINHEIRKQS